MKNDGPVTKNDSKRCEVCGRSGSFDIGGHVVCEECYYNAGSCCLEFGGHDLWADVLSDERAQKKAVR